MAKDTKADSSVVMALSELARIEHDRIENDRAREEKRAADARAERERAEAAALEAERQRTERAIQEVRVAEAEARLRVEAERERDQRIAAMRAELARVESDRQALRVDLETRVTTREPARANGWALAFGLSSLVAASLAGLLVMQSGAHEVPLPIAHAPAQVVVVAPASVPEVAPVVAPAPEAPQVAVVEHPTPHRHPRGDHGHVEPGHTGTELIGLPIDEGDDGDVLGHLAEDAPRTLHH